VALIETFTHKGKPWTKTHVEPHRAFAMGVDLGKSMDYTAITVIDHTVTPLLDAWDVDERTCRIKQKAIVSYDVRHAERLPLGMLYPDQLSHVRRLLAQPPLAELEVPVCFDATSNAGVVDLAEQVGLNPVRITFTSGHEPTGEGRKWGVPKSTLVSTLDAKLHCGELRIAEELTAADALKDELANLHVTVRQTGGLLFEHRVGKHDDLVFAIAMALWWLVAGQPRDFCHVGTHHIGYEPGGWQKRLGNPNNKHDKLKNRPVHRRR
jgi:hypothetical protein